MSATAFYIPSSSTSSSKDIIALQMQTTALKADLGTPTSANTANQIVKRDGTGGFSAGTIKATDLEAVGTTLTIAGQNNTQSSTSAKEPACRRSTWAITALELRLSISVAGQMSS